MQTALILLKTSSLRYSTCAVEGGVIFTFKVPVALYNFFSMMAQCCLPQAIKGQYKTAYMLFYIDSSRFGEVTAHNTAEGSAGYARKDLKQTAGVLRLVGNVRSTRPVITTIV